MRRFSTLFLVLCTVGLGTSGFAQPPQQEQQRGIQRMRSQIRQRFYNPATVETLAGTVVRVEHYVQSRRWGYGTHLIIRTEAGEVPVHLGPTWYIEQQDIVFEPGEKVTVTGSRVTVGGEQVVIAQKVMIGNDTLELRDENGVPVWRGQRWHSQ